MYRVVIYRIIISILLVLLLLTSPIFSRPTKSFTPEDSVAICAIKTAVLLGRQFPDSIWEGYNLDSIPMIIYKPSSWTLLLNSNATLAGFSQYPATWPDLPGKVLFYPGQFRDLTGQLAFDIQVDSASLAAVPFRNEDMDSFLEFMVHENFHQFQHVAFGEIQWEREELYPIEDFYNNAIARLEIYLLKDALRLLENSERELAEEKMACFIAVRRHRWQHADPFVVNYEQGQEIKEGTAEYAGLKAVCLSPLVLDASAPGSQADTPSQSSSTQRLLEKIVGGLDEVTENSIIRLSDISRNRIYPVAAAQELILDHYSIDWKTLAQKADTNFTFAGKLGEYFNFDSSISMELVSEAKDEYAFDKILSDSKDAKMKFQAGFDSALAEFKSQGGTRIEFRYNGKNLIRSRSSNSEKWIVDRGSKELRDHYDIYILQNLSEQNLPAQFRKPEFEYLIGKELFFQLKDAGLFETTDWDTQDKKLVFYAPRIDSLLIDGIRQDAVDGFKCFFDHIDLSGPNFQLRTERTGALSISGDTIVIELR